MCSQESKINKMAKKAAKIIHLLIPGVYVLVCARYEVSVIKHVPWRTVQRCWWCQYTVQALTLTSVILPKRTKIINGSFQKVSVKRQMKITRALFKYCKCNWHYLQLTDNFENLSIKCQTISFLKVEACNGQFIIT